MKTKRKKVRLCPRESFHLPADLRTALLKFQERREPRPGKSAVLRTALQHYLASQGFWP